MAYDWLPPADVLSWLKIDEAGDRADVVELCRTAAAAWCQDQRPDLDRTPAGDLDDPSPRIIMAGVLATARLYARQGSPAGLASYGEFGAAEVLRSDPDVARFLGIDPPSQTPRVG